MRILDANNLDSFVILVIAFLAVLKNVNCCSKQENRPRHEGSSDGELEELSLGNCSKRFNRVHIKVREGLLEDLLETPIILKIEDLAPFLYLEIYSGNFVDRLNVNSSSFINSTEENSGSLHTNSTLNDLELRIQLLKSSTETSKKDCRFWAFNISCYVNGSNNLSILLVSKFSTTRDLDFVVMDIDQHMVFPEVQFNGKRCARFTMLNSSDDLSQEWTTEISLFSTDHTPTTRNSVSYDPETVHNTSETTSTSTASIEEYDPTTESSDPIDSQTAHANLNLSSTTPKNTSPHSTSKPNCPGTSASNSTLTLQEAEHRQDLDKGKSIFMLDFKWTL